ncbi:MAG: hypothetical protein AW10_01034 [Candidatus Accumulibacter appositus]|uniref:Aldo/keto reductase n=1 Tax=Candidatus Accumulibacter appositus TaxID=1454003 RepID=A0A011P277_9PROT|nr:MAG: hypothetical protein AW10_01034 [Candidatus Accumulibacter appositus]
MKAGDGEPMFHGRRAALKAIAAGGLALASGALAAAPATSSTADTTMLRRPIPSSGELIAAVGLGTYQSFDVPDSADPALEKVLARFVALGGQMVDSSPMDGG